MFWNKWNIIKGIDLVSSGGVQRTLLQLFELKMANKFHLLAGLTSTTPTWIAQYWGLTVSNHVLRLQLVLLRTNNYFLASGVSLTARSILKAAQECSAKATRVVLYGRLRVAAKRRSWDFIDLKLQPQKAFSPQHIPAGLNVQENVSVWRSSAKDYQRTPFSSEKNKAHPRKRNAGNI